ncbi:MULTISPECIES: hypothetical protein [unclassified Mesorhizobium]|uniref:hypothetical protein n=1 Tax=unclassified Mesorhizobium TaxID=325217 RepID=UPI001CCEA29F|nr:MULTISPECIES: hypothetical protein [unclassified Mesorhizobium]MBZ9684287.1 hypothetical protein [Mesorhizobium sp. CO1-1-2]
MLAFLMIIVAMAKRDRSLPIPRWEPPPTQHLVAGRRRLHRLHQAATGDRNDSCDERPSSLRSTLNSATDGLE